MENIWARLTNIVYENGKQFSSHADLWRTIEVAWNKLSLEDISELVKSIPQRLEQLYIKNGGITDW